MEAATPTPTSSTVNCSLCKADLGTGPAQAANGHPVCPKCLADLQTELAAQAPTSKAIILGIIGSLLGTLIAAGVWAAVTIMTNYEVGYIAILVGLLAGEGAVRLSGKFRGPSLQLIALVAAAVGLVVAKVIILDYTLVEEIAKTEPTAAAGYLSPSVIVLSLLQLPLIFRPFDLIWMFIAGRVAWRIPRAKELKIT